MGKASKSFLTALRRGFRLLQQKDPLILSSSTAFFATFSLSPILVILVSLFGFFSGTRTVSNYLFRTIGSTFGRRTSKDVETIVNNFLEFEKNWWITIAGFLFFLFVSTTLLTVIKYAIEKIWHIRANRKLDWKYYSRARGTQVGFIIFTGLLLALSLYVDTSLGISLDYLQSVLPGVAIGIIQVLSFLFSLITITAWFSVLFKFIPEASLTWDTALTGGFVTALLFVAGKFGLGKILVHARLETIFGASASFALLLLFIFYCSFILYYGAAFTHEYGALNDSKICAGKYSHAYEERMIERSSAELS